MFLLILETFHNGKWVHTEEQEYESWMDAVTAARSYEPRMPLNQRLRIEHKVFPEG